MMPGSDDESTVTATADQTLRRGLSSDLKSRIVAGILLALVTGALAWTGGWPFALLIMLVAVLMSWEWSRVVRGGGSSITLAVHAASAALAVLLSAMGLAALGLATVLASALVVLALEIGGRSLVSAVGVLYTGLPAVALLWFRGDEPWGAWAILFLFAVVVATDTFAYISGRLIGGPKLWPSVSPNKTWAGFIGGISAAALMGAAFHWAFGSSPLALGLTGLGLGIISQAGDLAESALKRAFGVKDASGLIPGHGGFMDRADGIVAAAVAAALYALFAGPQSPAASLLAFP